jgi:MFS family permease
MRSQPRPLRQRRPQQVLPRDAGSRQTLRTAFDALRLPVFRWWFASQVLSGSGYLTQAVAQAWLVLRLGGGGVALGAVSACTFAPLMLGGPWAGTLVDHFDRRRLLVITQSSFLAVSSALGLLTVLGSVRLWMVFVGALTNGCINAVDQPARQVYVIELVGRERTANAISLNEIVINASRVLGPATGGALLVATGVGGCFFFNAVTYVPPLLVLLRFRPAVRIPTVPRKRGAAREGLRYALGQPAIRYSLLMAAASGMLFGLLPLPLVATHVFHVGAGGYALMMAAFGCGAVGGAVMAAIGGAFPSGRGVRGLAVTSGLAVLGTAASPDIVVELVGLAVCGLCSIWFIARANAFVQLLAAPEMRGRVMGVWTMALPGMAPLTGLLSGLVAQELGPQEAFALAGLALVLSGSAAWRTLGAMAETTG